MLAVEGLGEDTGARGFTHATRSTEEEGLRHLVVADGVFESRRDGLLPHHRVESRGSVLTCRDDEIIHNCLFFQIFTRGIYIKLNF